MVKLLKEITAVLQDMNGLFMFLSSVLVCKGIFVFGGICPRRLDTALLSQLGNFVGVSCHTQKVYIHTGLISHVLKPSKALLRATLRFSALGNSVLCEDLTTCLVRVLMQALHLSSFISSFFTSCNEGAA